MSHPLYEVVTGEGLMRPCFKAQKGGRCVLFLVQSICVLDFLRKGQIYRLFFHIECGQVLIQSSLKCLIFGDCSLGKLKMTTMI